MSQFIRRFFSLFRKPKLASELRIKVTADTSQAVAALRDLELAMSAFDEHRAASGIAQEALRVHVQLTSEAVTCAHEAVTRSREVGGRS